MLAFQAHASYHPDVTSAVHIPPGEYVPTADGRVVLRDVTWSQFEDIVAVRGERSVPRVAYFQGELELMSSSRAHEKLGSLIGRLVETYALDRGIELCPYGSWLLKSASKARGVEPDECYIFGSQDNKDVPDLAIEVVCTSGGLDKLEIYGGLGVPEVWFWMGGRIHAHVLREGTCVQQARSVVLPGLDLDLLAAHLEHPTLR